MRNRLQEDYADEIKTELRNEAKSWGNLSSQVEGSAGILWVLVDCAASLRLIVDQTKGSSK